MFRGSYVTSPTEIHGGAIYKSKYGEIILNHVQMLFSGSCPRMVNGQPFQNEKFFEQLWVIRGTGVETDKPSLITVNSLQGAGHKPW